MSRSSWLRYNGRLTASWVSVVGFMPLPLRYHGPFPAPPSFDDLATAGHVTRCTNLRSLADGSHRLHSWSRPYPPRRLGSPKSSRTGRTSMSGRAPANTTCYEPATGVASGHEELVERAILKAADLDRDRRDRPGHRRSRWWRQR